MIGVTDANQLDYPPWVHSGLGFLGQGEIPGPKTATFIHDWLARLHAWWADDETPWCGTFVAAMLDEHKVALPKTWYRALTWADWGTYLPAPVPGCVVVFMRAGGGHVGFVMGSGRNGTLAVLGGNQGNNVSVALFDRSRAVGFRWPPGVPPSPAVLSYVGGLTFSRSEA